jgi:stage V sporulation protein G
MLNITDTRIRIVKKDDGKLKAVASIIIDDCFAIHDIKIISGSDGNFIAMPSRKTPDGEFKDIAHPINTETREMIRKKVLEAYETALREEV